MLNKSHSKTLFTHHYLIFPKEQTHQLSRKKLKIIATAIWNKNVRSKDRINVWDSKTHKLKQTLISCRVVYEENISICEDKNILLYGGKDNKLYKLNDITTEGIKPYQIVSCTNKFY